MTTAVDVVNRALQKVGTRTTIASLTEQSNEAIQANLILGPARDELLRKAPWNCSTNYAPLTYITSTPGTPGNPSTQLVVWSKGLPPPGWAYEYQYPSDCLRPLFLVPQITMGFSGGVPITQAITGAMATTWRRGPPVKFSVGIDQFLCVVTAAVVAGGTGYRVGEVITLQSGQVAGQPPIGAPAQLQVLTLSGSSVATVQVFNQIPSDGPAPLFGGNYFYLPTNPVAQASSNLSGTGATFNLTFADYRVDKRVILTQQESAICCYIRQVLNIDAMDQLFQDAWASLLGARLTIALTGDKSLANMQIQLTNEAIMEARKADGNEGLTVQDSTPDWIRTRGTYFPMIAGWTSDVGYDWGNLFPSY